MTGAEFQKWVKRHGDAFPLVRGWFKAMHKDQCRATLWLWFLALEQFTLGQAEAATEEMNRSTLGHPRYAAEHKDAILTIAGRIRREETARQERVCDDCEDKGWIRVYDKSGTAKEASCPSCMLGLAHISRHAPANKRVRMVMSEILIFKDPRWFKKEHTK